MKQDCDICQGYGHIKVPIYQRMTTRAFDIVSVSAWSEPVLTARSYPCPECSPKVTEDHVRVLHAEEMIVTHPTGYESEIEDATRKHLSFMLVDELLRSQSIAFVVGPMDKLRQVKPMRATLGVVSKQHVATLEERIASHRQTTAEIVAQKARDKISGWGSHYTGNDGPISKEMACRFVREALAEVLTPETKP